MEGKVFLMFRKTKLKLEVCEQNLIFLHFSIIRFPTTGELNIVSVALAPFCSKPWV